MCCCSGSMCNTQSRHNEGTVNTNRILFGFAVFLLTSHAGRAQEPAGGGTRASTWVEVSPIGFVAPGAHGAFVLGPLGEQVRFGSAAPRTKRDHASRLTIFSQTVGGMLGAVAAGAVSYHAFDRQQDRRVKGDEGYSVRANTAYAVGSFVGSTAAVWLIGESDGPRAPLRNPAIATGVVTLPLLLMRKDPYLPIIGVLFGAPLQSLAGTTAYQMSRTNSAELPSRQ